MASNDTNTKGETMCKIIGLADEGKCDHCGANCPKRRVNVETENGVEQWGVVCASKVRGEKGTATSVKHLSKFAAACDEFRSAASRSEIERVGRRYGFPYEIRGTELRVWSGYKPGKPDVTMEVAA